MRQRTKLVINAGNFLELIAAVCAVVGIYRLAGVSWALIATAILLVVGAELVLGDQPWRVPLPHRPHPQRWLAEQRDRARGVKQRGKWELQRRRERRAK